MQSNSEYNKSGHTYYDWSCNNVNFFTFYTFVVYHPSCNNHNICDEHRKWLTKMNGMLISMSLGMSVGILIGTILGVAFHGDLFQSTVYSILIGVVVGFLAGIPIGLPAVIDGILSGLMGE